MNRRIIIADREPTMCRGIGSLLENEKRFTVVACTKSQADTLAQVETLKPDILITGENFDDGEPLDSIVLLAPMREKGLRIFMHAICKSPILLQAALDRGVLGIVCKYDETHELLAAIKAVADGKPHHSAAAGQLMHELFLPGRKSISLSDNELAVLSRNDAVDWR